MIVAIYLPSLQYIYICDYFAYTINVLSSPVPSGIKATKCCLIKCLRLVLITAAVTPARYPAPFYQELYCPTRTAFATCVSAVKCQ